MMSRKPNSAASTIAAIAMSVVVFAVMTACSQVTEVSTTELEQIVERDGVPFDMGSIPDEILDRLASHRVVLVGEIHFLREHRELMAELLRDLHARGVRQLLVEWTQVADWLLADFVTDGRLEPDWEPPQAIAAGALARAIRDINRTLPKNEHLQIRAIDVTLDEYGGAESFLWSLGRLARHLPAFQPLSTFLQSDYESGLAQVVQLRTLWEALKARRQDLLDAWGEGWYGTVVETVEVEMSSIPIRAVRQSDYDKSVRLREDAIKRLADKRLQGYPYGTLINVGSTHAQKERLMGTKVEWLGDYLVHRSAAADGSVIVLSVTAAQIAAAPGSGYPDYDLSASPENELFRVMNRNWPDHIVYLPVDDPLFGRDAIPMNFDGTIYVSAPKRHYDAFLLLPLAHRVPIN